MSYFPATIRLSFPQKCDLSGFATFRTVFKQIISGMAFQGNVFSTETLEDAVAHPENYPSLQVRVCGWNEYFTKMDRATQLSFIRQTKQTK